MKHDTVIINKITPDEGMVLTNGETFSKEVYLGTNDKAENWHEITEEEYQELLRKQEEAIG